MAAPKIVEDSSSVVLIGSFNPAIFQPAWFAAKGLIRETEATGADIQVVHPDVASFRADWLSLTVTRERFQALASDPAHQLLLRDLVAGTFQLLEHTPITRIGINRVVHFSFADAASVNAFGDLLMPKEPWVDLLKNPGLRSLVVSATRQDDLQGLTVVRVEPSLKHANGAYVDVNHDILAVGVGQAEVMAFCLALLQEQWDRLQADALKLAQNLVLRSTGGSP
jgi:hypothetical protein